MDFARRQLLKYGWEEGKGLGKEESGIKEAIKPKLKFDTAGVGHDSSEQFTFNWWENVYNHAADNINVVHSNDGSIKMKLSTDDSVDITTKKYSFKNMKKKNNLEYGCFLKTSKLTPSGVVDHEDKATVTTNDVIENVKLANMTDEELFAACGGRTAHKGARHGLKLSGKLSRIEEQEMRLLKQMKNAANNMEIEENISQKKYSLSDSETYEPKLHKKKKSKKKKVETAAESNDETEVLEARNYKKRKHSQTENYEDMYLEVQKRTEHYIAKQERRKIKKMKRLEKRKISKITNMLENVCVSNQQENKDDGFEEKSKTADEDESANKKHKKKKRKLMSEIAKNNEKDDGFEEYISEVNEKLMYYKELRKDLQETKRKGDEKRISKMAEDFERKL